MGKPLQTEEKKTGKIEKTAEQIKKHIKKKNRGKERVKRRKRVGNGQVVNL